MDIAKPIVLIRGGGDLASGVALRLHRSGFAVLITEIEKPLAVRRSVAFAEAIYAGEVKVEEVTGSHLRDTTDIEASFAEGIIPVIIDPSARIRAELKPLAIIDARMRKNVPENEYKPGEIVIGLGPGFTVGRDCAAVVETNRGHMMGRVIWGGSAQEDTGVPEPIQGYDVDRVLRAPVAGMLTHGLEIGTLVSLGDEIARIEDQPVRAPFDGVLRGLIHDGLHVHAGMKIGDLDPRRVREYCFLVSDKALAVGGGVLEALLSFDQIREAFGE